MAVITLPARGKVAVIMEIEKHTAPAGVNLVAGQLVRQDTAGRWVLADATTAANHVLTYITIGDAQAGFPVTAIKRGLVNMGDALDALAIGAPVFLSNTAGALDTAAGTVSVMIGRVFALLGSGKAPDKVLRVDITV